MTLSGQSQAELVKATLVLIAAGVIVYYGKKFVDSVTSKIPDIATIPEKIVVAAGDALGSAGAAVVTASKSGIEKAMDNQKTTGGNVPLNSLKLFGAYSKMATDSLMGKSYNVPFDSGSGQGW